MFPKNHPIFSRFDIELVNSPIWVIVLNPLFECLDRVAACVQKPNFRIVLFGVHRETSLFVSPKSFFCTCGNDHHQQHNHCLFHLVFSFAVVLFLNINSFAACSQDGCNLYADNEYAQCASSTTGWPQYQCGGGSGSCSDVCGGCGWRPKTAGILNAFRDQFDAACKAELGCNDAKASGLKLITQTYIGRCGVGFQTADSYVPICVGCMSSSEPSSSSSSSFSSSSSAFVCPVDCKAFPPTNQSCYDNGSQTSCGVIVDRFTPYIEECGYCGFSLDVGDNSPCYTGYRNVTNGTNTYVGFVGCSSSSSVSSSSLSSFDDISSAGDGGDSQGGGGSSAGEGSSGSGEGGGGDGIPCGWGSYPPCETYQVNNPPGLCAAYPDLCYTILSLDDSLGGLHRAMQDVAVGVGAVRDTLAGFHSDVNDSLHRLMELMSGQDTTAAGGFDSIPYVSGDGPDTTGSGGVPGGSWVRSVIDGISIPTAARSCPSVPKVTIQLLGRPFDVDYDICSEAYYVANTHPLQLVGLFFRAIAGIVAVFIVIGSISSLNGGLHRMKILGRG